MPILMYANKANATQANKSLLQNVTEIIIFWWRLLIFLMVRIKFYPLTYTDFAA